MTDEQILEILETWSDEFTVADIFTSIIRWVGFWIAKGIAGLAAELEGLAKTIYSLLPDLLADTKLGDFIDSAKPLLTVLLGLSIMVAGYIIIVKKDGKSNVLQNILILFVVLTVMPLMSGKVATLTMGASQGIFGITEEGSAAAYEVIDDNITDLYLLIDEDRLTGSVKDRQTILESKDKNVISPNKISISSIKIKSTLDYDENNFGNYEKLTKRELDISPSGKAYLKKMNGGIFDVSHNYYYRYHVNWFVMLTSLIAMFVTLGLTCIRLAKMLWEIIMSMFIAPFVAVTDVATGQRIKELLRNILSLFAVMGIISVIIGVYNIGMSILSTWQSTGKIGGVLYIVLLIALAALTIDGPDIIQRIYGIDAGGKGPLAMISGLYYGSRMAKEAAKMPVKAAAASVALGKSGYRTLTNLKSKASEAKQKTETEVSAQMKGSSSVATSNDKSDKNDVKMKSNTLGASASEAAAKENLSSDIKGTADAGAVTAGVVGKGGLSYRAKDAVSTAAGLSAASASALHRKSKSGNAVKSDIASGGKRVQRSQSLSETKGRISSPKVSEVKPSSKSGGKMPALSSIKNMPLTQRNAQGPSGSSSNNAYKTTDNRIISSLRSKEGFESGANQNMAQSKSAPAPDRSIKNFGQRRTLK